MRPMTKFYFGFVASIFLPQVFGVVEINPLEQTGVPNFDQLNQIMSNNTVFIKAWNLKVYTLKSQMKNLKTTMASENETISLKFDLINGNLENHTSIQTDLNYGILPEITTLLSGIISRKENLEDEQNSTMKIQKKLESNQKLLTEHPAAKSVEEQEIQNLRVAFFAQRNTSYNKIDSVIPYQTDELLNFGGAFNKTSGIFQVPVKGIYHFYFTALKMKREISGTSRLTVQLIKIGNPERVLAESHINSNDWYGWFPVQIQATIHLDKNSLVGVQLTEGSIYQSSDKVHLLTSFGGFLVSRTN